MHDLGLGPEVDAGERAPDAPHRGNCTDGVYGCSRCWNGANEGRGTIDTCEWCKTKEVHTRIVKAWDEPVLYAICAACEKRQRDELEAEAAAWDDDNPQYCDEDYDDE